MLRSLQKKGSRMDFSKAIESCEGNSNQDSGKGYSFLHNDFFPITLDACRKIERMFNSYWWKGSNDNRGIGLKS